MKIKTIFTILLIAVLALTAVAVAASGNGRYLVKSDNDALKGWLGTHHVFPTGFTTDLTDGQLRALEAMGLEVEPVPLWHISAPPGACSPWPECKDGDSTDPPARSATPSDQTPWGIEMVNNDSTITSTSGGAGVDVAVLDTGVNKDHLDLARRVSDCKDFTKGRRIQSSCTDGNGHGTHVAGTIVADGGADGLGVFGVAPEANLLAYRVCGNDGFCWSDDIATAIRYAADHGAEIISMSLGGSRQSSLTRDAISYAVANGVLVVAAAGNSGPADGSINWPGANPDVVAVGAIDSSETVPSWSSRGINDGDYIVEAREVEVGAPGVAVESTWKDGGYRTISGTSMATPHVSGLAANMWQGSASATRAYLQSRALLHDLHTAGDDTATGFGLPTVG